MGKLRKSIKAVDVALFSIAALLVLMNLGTSVRGIWLCDLCNQFRLLYIIIVVPLLLVALVVRRYPVSAILFGVLSYNLFQVLIPLLPLKASSVDPATSQLKILEFNTEFQHNKNFEAFIAQYGSSNPDLLALVEVDKAWINTISACAELNQALPYKKNAIDGPGLALWSRYPIKAVEVRHFGRTHHPRILATLDCDGRELHVLVAHPTTPQSEAGYKERNAELAVIAKELSTLKAPTLLIGDLNCGPWSEEISDLLAVSGMQDSESGFMPEPSWPARIGRVLPHIPIPPLIPIDHIFLSKDFNVLSRATGSSVGSDHLPVSVTAAFGPPTKSEKR